MGFATKVQSIKRKNSEQWYINFPSAVAQAMEFEHSETVEWIVEDRQTLTLYRPNAPESRKKKRQKQKASSANSKNSSTAPEALLRKSGHSKEEKD